MDTGQLPGQIIDRHPLRRKRTGIPSTSTNLKLTTLILANIVKQLELFPPQKLTYSRQPSKLEMSADALYQWKQRIFEYQSASESQPQQQTLFELTPDTCNADTLDPFSLQLHNLSFCEQPDWGDGFKSRRTPRFATHLPLFRDGCRPGYRLRRCQANTFTLVRRNRAIAFHSDGRTTIATTTSATTSKCTGAIPSMWLWVSTYAPNSTLASRMQRLTGKPTAADKRES